MTDEQNERAARVWREACAAFEDAADPELPKFENVNAGDQAAAAVIAADRVGLVAEIERLREAMQWVANDPDLPKPFATYLRAALKDTRHDADA